jgi:hypothetical protein
VAAFGDDIDEEDVKTAFCNKSSSGKVASTVIGGSCF